MRIGLLVIAAVAACAPLPDSGERKLSSRGIRPGATAAMLQTLGNVSERQVRYHVATPLRDKPSVLVVALRPTAEGYVREETVTIPEDTEAEARLIATMIRQRDGRRAEVMGTDIVLSGSETTDHRLRTLVSESGGVRTAYAPHDCMATPGICRAIRTGPNGTGQPLVVETSEFGGIWRETVRLDRELDPANRGVLLRESIYSLDPAGMLVDMNRVDHEKDLGQYQEIRRVE